MQVIKLINSIINKELSINKQVHKISLGILQQILSNKTDKTNFETILGKIKTANFSFDINGIKVTCYEYYFNNRKDYEIIKVREELNNNRHYLDSTIEYYRNNGFNTTIERIWKNIEYVINRITTKLGKIIIKYKQDYLKEARFTNPFKINFLLF